MWVLTNHFKQLIYADNIEIIEKCTYQTEESFLKLEVKVRQKGLIINENKTKYIVMTYSVDHQEAMEPILV